MFNQILISAVALGAVYALIAVGFTIVFATKRLVNFAHGEFVMMGGILSVVFYQFGLPLVPAMVLAVLAVGVAAAAIYLIVVDIKTEDTLSQVMITLGLAIAIKGAVEMTAGKSPMFLPALSSAATWSVGGLFINPQAVWLMLALILASLGLAALLRWTWLGVSMRAVAENNYASILMGMSPRRIGAASFVLAGVLGALAGSLLTPIASTAYDNGLFLGLKGFAAAILGGMGSPLGAVLGGLLLGLCEAFSAGYISSAYKDAITLSMLFVVLMFFPQGIFGGKAIRKL
ncbi:branched-chain amino acid ABC transporter permease [Mesorhizobium sp. CCNWLW179-1]|uniref:branched-chain amino acid ABC transporter permease n=1 Tax=unclassified Mesorhizobium TaxID=325217 RepID=UPI003014A261